MEETIEGNKAALVKVARRIDGLLSEVILLQRDHVVLVCSGCENPCCNRVQRLFDEKDIIFARVFLEQNVPRRKYKRNGGCQFLSPTGCTLTPKVRPFACHRYLCSKLEEEMLRQEPELPQILSHKFRILEELRGQLWKEYLDQ